MPPETDKIKAVFLAALDKAAPAERAAFLDEACAEDAALRQRVEALLQAHDQTDRLLDRPAAEHLGGEADEAAAPDDGLDFLAPPLKSDSLGRLGQYEVLEVAGRGGMGVVFRSFDDKLQRVVAVKALAPQLATSSAARRRFAREARAAAAVTHDNVIAIHAVEDDGPVPYLVMEFVDGPSLQEKLDRVGPLSLKETLRIGLQIAEGLAAAHRQGLVHRDVKPANILLKNGVERVKLTDFGLARAGDDASLTQSGIVAGTPMYMSPEQAQGEAVDFRSDLFSLGSVLYAMCTGRPPFRAPTSLAILKRVCEEAPRPIREINPELPAWLGDLLTRLHAKAPADRFASTQEVADLLTRRLAELQNGATPSPATDRPSTEPPEKASPVTPPALPRRRGLMAAAVVLALLAGLSLSEAAGVTNVRGTVIRLFSGEGTLVVEVDDPGVSVSLVGEELVITGAGVREIRLKPGQYEVKATKEGKLIRQELVTVTKDGRQVVRVSREPAPARLADVETAVWERVVAALTADQQVAAVVARLKQLNPDFDGKVTHKIADNVVTELKFSPGQVTNIAPVRALSKLTVLDCYGGYGEKGRLADLSPLKGMSLKTLFCNGTAVSDLSPLKGMPLTYFDCSNSLVSDLSPLKGMSLKTLWCNGTSVSDLSPLQGMPLTNLNCSSSLVSDLSPLKGMPLRILDLQLLPISDLSPLKGMSLTSLVLYRTQVTDLLPVKGMPLQYLNLGHLQVSDLSLLKDMTTLDYLVLGNTPVSDLSALKGLSLRVLRFRNTKVSDLTPLKGMPLKELWFDYQPERDGEVLRSLTSLEQINGKPAAEFWKEQEKTKAP